MPGSLPGSKRTSTTGPTILMSLPTFTCGLLVSGRRSSGPRRLGAARDLEQLARDAGLARLVVFLDQRRDDLVRVVGRVLHRDPPRGEFGCERLQDRRQELHLEVPRDQALDD